MITCLRLWRRFGDRSGATAIEYALTTGLIALSLSVALTGASAKLQTVFGEVNAAFGSSCNGGAGGNLPMGIRGC